MGRWAYLDSDEERLPQGMKRAGYDADTQCYTYIDKDGSKWTGAPGNRYGTLYPAKPDAPRLEDYTIDEEVEGEEPDVELEEGTYDPPAQEEEQEPISPASARLVRNVFTRLTRSLSMKSKAPPPGVDEAVEAFLHFGEKRGNTAAEEEILAQLPAVPPLAKLRGGSDTTGSETDRSPISQSSPKSIEAGYSLTFPWDEKHPALRDSPETEGGDGKKNT